MASNIPDLSTLTSSSQIFSSTSNHSLPQIRAIHKALHAAVDDKRSRLRVQVGGSYRDLLGTADAIVSMKGDMDEVLNTLGRMGARCGRGVVGKKVGGLGKFVGDEDGEDKAGLGTVARARLVEGCALGVERLLRGRGAGRGDRLVCAAKVRVLSRLLVKSFRGEVAGRSVAGAVEVARKSLEGSERRLLRIIDKALQTVGEKEHREEILKALAACSLVTSLGARDVMRYFLKVRGEAVHLTFELDEDERTRSTEDVLRGVRLYTKTLLDVPALVPHKLTEALGALKKNPLIKDPSLRHIEGLRLDIYERWCGDEIEYFTPFLRHDDLDRNQAREMLDKWARNGADVLLQGLERTLSDMSEFKAIVDMRTSVLKLWISEGGKVKSVDASDLLDRIRKIINKRIIEVIKAKVNMLRLVGSEVSVTVESWRDGVTDQRLHLWEHESFDMDLTHSAADFAQDVISRLYGRNDPVSKAMLSYKSWKHVVEDMGQAINQLTRRRWDNDIDEIEEEETIKQRQELLSEEDPRTFKEQYNRCLHEAFITLERQLDQAWSSRKDGTRFVHMYVLRVIRDIQDNRPDYESSRTFGQSLFYRLHREVALIVTSPAFTGFESGVLSMKKVVTRALWEGEPELPTSPSPAIFTFLRDLHMDMASAGEDLWYPALLAALAEHLHKELYESWAPAVRRLLDDSSEAEEGKTDADSASDEPHAENEDAGSEPDVVLAKPAPEQPREVMVQWMFDISYLRYCFSASYTAEEGGDHDLSELEHLVYKDTGLDAAARQQVQKAAREYWKRTSLLFGFFA